MPASMAGLLPTAFLDALSVVKMGAVLLKGIGTSGELLSVLPRGLSRTFGSVQASAHCDRCFGPMSCPACEADDDRLRDWAAD